MSLLPMTLIIQETHSPLSTGHPTKTPNDCASHQMCRMQLRRHAKTPTEKQVSHKWRKTQQVMSTGDYISTDQLDLYTSGFIDQLKGIPTKQLYHVVTIFMDHYS